MSSSFLSLYCKLGTFWRDFYFHETSHLREVSRNKNTLPNGEITLSFTDVGKLCPNRKFLMSQICF